MGKHTPTGADTERTVDDLTAARRNASRRRHPAGRLLAAGGLAVGIVAAGTGVASATGAVANSCIVDAPVVATRVAPDGLYVNWLPCGSGAGGITYATVEGHPFTVTDRPGMAPECYQSGARYYPQGTAYTAVLSPTVSCAGSRAPGGRTIAV